MRWKEKSDKFILRFSLLIVGIWVVIMGLQMRKFFHFQHSPLLEAPSVRVSFNPDEEWLGIYMKGQKIGWMSSSMEKDEDGYWLKDRIYTRLTVMGSPKEITTFIQSKVNPDYTLDSFMFDLRSGAVNFRAIGQVDDLTLIVNITTGGHEEKVRISLDGPIYLSSGLVKKLQNAQLKKGKSYAFPFFDPSTLSHKTATVIWEADESILHGGENVLARRLSMTYAGATFTAWFNHRGERIREEGPMGLALVKEERQTAQADLESPKVQTVDIIAASSVIPSRRIPKAKDTSYLKVGIWEVDLEGLDLEGDRQKLSGNILEIQKEAFPQRADYVLPYPKDGPWAVDMRPSPLIQSDHQMIAQLAHRIAAGSTEPAIVLQRLNQWVYSNLEKIPVISVPSALEVLQTRKGDCNEHAVLLAALVRAAGIPARVAAGLVYSEYSFFYHAWVEAFVGQWVSADPVMGQLPADATHIRLIRGNLQEQVAILRLLGKMKVEVLANR